MHRCHSHIGDIVRGNNVMNVTLEWTSPSLDDRRLRSTLQRVSVHESLPPSVAVTNVALALTYYCRDGSRGAVFLPVRVPDSPPPIDSVY